jgi:hypothetical protein
MRPGHENQCEARYLVTGPVQLLFPAGTDPFPAKDPVFLAFEDIV